MVENSAIEWCDHTFNPWVGCTKISPACDHCYAEAWAKRTGQSGLWTGDRRRTGEANWRQPLKWNRQAEAEGRRFRVFCASLADVFDNQVPNDWRLELFCLIHGTPHLDWLLLTKRPQNIGKMMDGVFEQPPENLWLGTTVANQEEADRNIPHLLRAPAMVRFLSCEPMLGRIDLCEHLKIWWNQTEARWMHGGTSPIDWVIAGGESGPGARPLHPDWARGIRDQCAAAGVPFLFKQWGEWIPAIEEKGCLTDDGGDPHRLEHKSGPTRHLDPDCMMWRVGKKAAGRLLDGRMHDAFPRSA